MTATSPAGSPASAKSGSSRSVVAALRRTAKDWLDRPMTSWHLITGIFVLMLGFGLLMVLSASSITSYNKSGSPFAAFENQALFAGIGLVGFLAANRLSTRLMRSLSLGAVAVSILLLAVVLLGGNAAYGAQSWIKFGPINLQPSELAKLSLLVWMSHVLAARRNTLRSLRTLLFPVVPVFLLMVLLIMLEPDLGTTITLTLIFIAVLWFGGAPVWMFGLLVAGVAAGGFMLATGAGYRNERILTWLHPDRVDPDSLFQINQSFFGLGHGGLFGAGLGQATSASGWLPNADSDFIFAVIGEELGLVGAGLVVLLYGLLAYTGLRIARRNVDPFIKILASSATIWLVGQAAINIGYVVGLLPVTGLTLPMISRGGTSLVVTMAVFGMLANFARREPQAAAALNSQGPGRVASFLGLGPRPPKPPKPRKVRAAKPTNTKPRTAKARTAKPRPATGRTGTAQSGSGRRPAARPTGERPLLTGTGSGRGRGTDSGRRPDRARDPRAGQTDAVRPDRSRTAEPARSRRDQQRDTQSARSGSAARTQPPRLRRSADAGSDGAVVDWTGRPFVEPRRQRPDGPRTDGPRDDARGNRQRPNGREVRPEQSGARSGGRGRPVRP